MNQTIIKNCTLYNMDCMEYMNSLPDNAFDLAIVDPPYGIGAGNDVLRHKYKNEKKDWDNEIPKKEYFDELMRVSKNQIIWGGNYFFDYLGNTQGFLIWDKVQPHDFSLAMCEFAWSSIQYPAKMFRQSVLLEKNKIHPTQKPIKLYEWLLTNYAKQGNKILDTHLGSGSHAIACNNLGFELVGLELDSDYFKASCERIAKEAQQERLF